MCIRDRIYIHVIPFLYYILYTFLLRQAFIDFFHAREDPERRKAVNRIYVFFSVLLYAAIYLLG